jgi:hypothetical protein
VSDPNDSSIPVLHEILVQGRVAPTREEAGGVTAPAGSPAAPEALAPGLPREPGFKTEPVLPSQPVHVDDPGLMREPELAPQPVLTPEQTRAPEPVLAPEPTPAQRPAFTPEPVSAPQAAHPVEPTLAAQQALHTTEHATEHAHLRRRSRLHHGDDHGHVSPGVFDRTEPAAPVEAGTIVPPDIAQETTFVEPSRPTLDAEVIAERLRGRFAGFLTGEGRGIIETRCRDALQEHTTLLVSQITREVALTLETEMTGWVREAVEEEIARRAGRG